MHLGAAVGLTKYEVARWAPLPLSAKKWDACTGHQYETSTHQLWLCSRD